MKKSKFSIKRLIYNDRILMVLSVILGIIVWAIIAWVVDPTYTTDIKGVPVEFDKTTLEKLGLSVISGQNQTVSVEVTGDRVPVSELTADNFIAKASLVGVDAPGTYDLEVQVSKKLQNTDYDINQPNKPTVITAKFDKYVSKKIALSVDFSSISAPDGYIRQQPYITPNEVTVSGPEAEVSRVAKCMAEPELPEVVDKTYGVKGPIVLYDVMGQRVDMTNLKLDKETADVTIPVLKKKVLPVKVKFINVPEGFPISDLDYTLSETQIEVAGPAETIDNLTEISIGYIDLKLIEPDSVFAFDVELGDNFLNIQNITTIKVDFATTGFEVRKFNIKSTNINLINEPANYSVKLETRGINNISIVGPPDVLDKLTTGDIVGEIDLGDRDLGTGQQHNVPVQISVPSRGTVWAIGDYSAVITVTEK